MYGYIYKTTNLINNKIYIGQHIADKFTQGYKGSGKLIVQAFKKYGKRNFFVELVKSCNSLDELNDQEMFWIDYFKSTNPEIGYNIKLGGNNAPWSKEVKLKMSNSAKGKKKSEQARKNNSLAKMGNHNAGQCNLGKIVVNNGITNKYIKPEDLNTYLDNGFIKGVVPTSKERLIKYKALYKDRVYINKNGYNKYVHQEQLEEYLVDGWIKGRVGYSKERGEHISATKSGRIKVVNNNIIKYIKLEDLAMFELQGFKRP